MRRSGRSTCCSTRARTSCSAMASSRKSPRADTAVAAVAAVDAVVLAHHADDQAETLLLQLLRGGGPQGLAAMPRHRAGRPALLRPLLELTRRTLAAYARARGVAWIDDESNAERKHARNFL